MEISKETFRERNTFDPYIEELKLPSLDRKVQHTQDFKRVDRGRMDNGDKWGIMEASYQTRMIFDYPSELYHVILLKNGMFGMYTLEEAQNLVEELSVRLADGLCMRPQYHDWCVKQTMKRGRLEYTWNYPM